MPSSSPIAAETKTSASPRRASAGLLALVLGLGTLLVYLPSLWNGFVEYDDPFYVLVNPHVNTGLKWQNVSWAFSSRALDMGIWGPLTWISHMVDCQLFGLHPAGHHTTSIVLHALCAVLLFLVLYAGTGARWRSLLVAALFALHPLNVENVSWISERKSIVCMFFILATVALYGWYAHAPRWSRYLCVMATFALALLSKPLAVTLPVLLLLLDCWPLGRFASDEANAALRSRKFRHLLMEKVPLLALSAVFSQIAMLSEKNAGALEMHVALPARLANAAIGYLAYIRKMFYPADLTCFYPYPGQTLSWWKAAVALVLLGSISAVVLRFRSHRPLLIGWLFYLIALLPMSGVVQVGSFAMADRFAYLPLIGLFIALVWELAAISARMRLSVQLQATIAIVVICALAACTMRTELYWRNNLTLFSHAHQVVLPNAFTETNLGSALLGENRLQEALDCYRRAATLAPRQFAPSYDIAYTLSQSGDFQGAVRQYRKALQLAASDEERVRSWRSMGIASLNSGDAAQAQNAFSQALALDPQEPQLRSLLDEARKMSSHAEQK